MIIWFPLLFHFINYGPKSEVGNCYVEDTLNWELDLIWWMFKHLRIDIYTRPESDIDLFTFLLFYYREAAGIKIGKQISMNISM